MFQEDNYRYISTVITYHKTYYTVLNKVWLSAYWLHWLRAKNFLQRVRTPWANTFTYFISGKSGRCKWSFNITYLKKGLTNKDQKCKKWIWSYLTLVENKQQKNCCYKMYKIWRISPPIIKTMDFALCIWHKVYSDCCKVIQPFNSLKSKYWVPCPSSNVNMRRKL